MPAQVVTIPILDDLIVENSKSFGVILTTFDSTITLGLQTASVIIRDDDSKLHCTRIYIYFAVEIFSTCYLFILLSGVTIGFNITEYSLSEGASSVSAIVSVLNGTLARNVSVRVFTSDDSAGE